MSKLHGINTNAQPLRLLLFGHTQSSKWHFQV